MTLIEDYEGCEDTVRKLYDSKLRLGILDALSESPMRLADLRRKVGANAPNTSSKAKELEGMGLVERCEDGFKLTQWGEYNSQEHFQISPADGRTGEVKGILG